jgi:hypothetical protein
MLSKQRTHFYHGSDAEEEINIDDGRCRWRREHLSSAICRYLGLLADIAEGELNLDSEKLQYIIHSVDSWVIGSDIYYSYILSLQRGWPHRSKNMRCRGKVEGCLIFFTKEAATQMPKSHCIQQNHSSSEHFCTGLATISQPL